MRKLIIYILCIFLFIPSSIAAEWPEKTAKIDWLDWDVIENTCVGNGCTINLMKQIVNLNECHVTQAIKFETLETHTINTELQLIYDENVEISVDYEDMFSKKYQYNIKLSELDFEKLEQTGKYMPKNISQYFDSLGIEKGERVFFSCNPDGDLVLIHFNPNEIDVFTEVKKGVVQDKNNGSSTYATQKYGIYPYFEDFAFTGIEDDESNSSNLTRTYSNQGKTLENVFLVCSKCAKCEKCANLAASNGSLSEATVDALKLSPYCAQEHTCGFFWIIDNGGEGIQSTEGVDCTECRMEDSAFCSRHTCQTQGCSNAVIGKNMTDARSSISAFKGKDNDYYSYYCIKHFCHEYNCARERINSYKDNPIYDEYSIAAYIDFPDYCTEHCSDCSIANCTNAVYEQAWTNSKLKICKEHYLNFSETLKENLAECQNCHSIMLPKNMKEVSSDVYICFDCLRNTGTNEDISSLLPSTSDSVDPNVILKDQNLMDIYGGFTFYSDNLYFFSDEGYSYCTICKATVQLIKADNIWYCINCGYSLDASQKLQTADFSGYYSSNWKYKNYKQKGQSWSTVPYSEGDIGSSGCGPTSVAICASGLGIDKDPGEIVGNDSLSAGYIANGKLLEKIGLTQTSGSKDEALAHLRTGQPVIVHATPGYYTDYGHFMALTGIAGNKVYLSDPNSYTSDRNGWIDIDNLISRNVDAFYLVSKSD